MSVVHLRAQGANGPKDWIGSVSNDGKLFIRYGTVGATQKTQQIAITTGNSAESELQRRAAGKRKEGYEDVVGENAGEIIDPDTGEAITSNEPDPLILSAKIRRNSSQESAYDQCRTHMPELFEAPARVVVENTHVTVATKIDDGDPLHGRWMIFLELVLREGGSIHLGRRNSNTSLDVTATFEGLTLSEQEIELTYVLGLHLRPVDMRDAQPDWMASAVMV